MTKFALAGLQQIIRSFHRNPSRILEMSFDDMRTMLKKAFPVNRFDVDGKKYGIYIKRGRRRYEYIFELNWIFKFNEVETVLLPDNDIMEMLALDKDEYLQLFKRLQTENCVYGEKKTGL
jgi:hypothetical protein